MEQKVGIGVFEEENPVINVILTRFSTVSRPTQTHQNPENMNGTRTPTVNCNGWVGCRLLQTRRGPRLIRPAVLSFPALMSAHGTLIATLTHTKAFRPAPPGNL